jgi:hypothetical protein
MLGHRLVDQLAERLSAIPRGPITRSELPSARTRGTRAQWAAAGIGSGSRRRCSTDRRGLLFEHSLFNGHPRFFGYITSSPAPIGMLGDFLGSPR